MVSPFWEQGDDLVHKSSIRLILLDLEPGYYEDGKFGIRIENTILVREANTPNNFGDRGYLAFEHVTVVPMGLKLIDVDLLSPDEKKWVNDYHAECRQKLEPLVASDPDAVAWLKKETVPI